MSGLSGSFFNNNNNNRKRRIHSHNNNVHHNNNINNKRLKIQSNNGGGRSPNSSFKNNIMKLNDVETETQEDQIEKEGLEYGGGDKSEGTFTPFNLNEIRQLGNINKSGEFTWTRRTVGEEDKEHVDDQWLKDSKTLSKEQVEKIKQQKKTILEEKNKKTFNKNESLKIIETYLKKFETVSEGLKRLGKESNMNTNVKKKKKKSWRDRKKKVSSNNDDNNEININKKLKDDFLILSSETTKLLIEGGMNNIYQHSKERILKLISIV